MAGEHGGAAPADDWETKDLSGGEEPTAADRLKALLRNFGSAAAKVEEYIGHDSIWAQQRLTDALANEDDIARCFSEALKKLEMSRAKLAGSKIMVKRKCGGPRGVSGW